MTVKFRSPDGAQRNPGPSHPHCDSRIALRSIRATCRQQSKGGLEARRFWSNHLAPNHLSPGVRGPGGAGLHPGLKSLLGLLGFLCLLRLFRLLRFLSHSILIWV